MVFHDEVLDRLTERDAARSTPARPRIAAERSGSRATDTIPTLPQVLALIAGRVPLLIEIKDQTLTMGETDGRLEAATAAALRGYAGPVAVMSFNPASVAHMARLAPDLPRGITTSAYDPEDWAPAARRHLRPFARHSGFDATGSQLHQPRSRRPGPPPRGRAESQGRGDPVLDDPLARGRGHCPSRWPTM
jgi:glycerophosphoryl diester phosphodiesterase